MRAQLNRLRRSATADSGKRAFSQSPSSLPKLSRTQLFSRPKKSHGFTTAFLRKDPT